jgi:hypothetical protein
MEHTSLGLQALGMNHSR